MGILRKLKSLEKIHKRIPKRQKKIHKKIYSQKEILISSLYVIKKRKYMYHIKDFILLKKMQKKIFSMPLHQTDIDGFKSDLFLLPYGPLEPTVINFTCDYSLVCVLSRWSPLIFCLQLVSVTFSVRRILTRPVLTSLSMTVQNNSNIYSEAFMRQQTTFAQTELHVRMCLLLQQEWRTSCPSDEKNS